jgi:hypothetical protein
MPALNPTYLSHKPLAWIGVLLYLLSYRTLLEKNNLLDGYDGLAYPQAPHKCEGRLLNYRTLDGTCNDLHVPMAGSIGMRLGRNMPGLVTDNKMLLYPNPREISLKILKRDQPIEAKGLNLLVTSWIQFQTHDWVFHDMTDYTNPIVVDLAQDDPMRAQGVTKLIIPRTKVDEPLKGEKPGKAKWHKNLSTAWWDLSQIYGTTKEANAKVRTFKDGLLKHDANTDWIPFDTDNGQEFAGFTENWWTGLAMWHNLFTKEHNYVATEIKKADPKRFAKLSPEEADQELHDLARLAVTCVNAKVHTVEWTEAVLNNLPLRMGMDTNWFGITRSEHMQTFIHHLPGGKSNHVLGGLVGGKQDNDTVPFSLTEEFASVYRMHSLLPDEVRFQTFGKDSTITLKNIKDTAFRNNQKIILESKLKPIDLYYSFGRQSPTALTVRNFPSFLQNLKKPNEDAIIDVAVRDIVRERERGVPRYNAFRRNMNLTAVASFDDLTTDKQMVTDLRKIYNNDIEQLDLLIGCLAENPRPENFGFGETAFSIFLLMASRRLKTDRFLNEFYNPKVYTEWGYQYTKDTGMKKMIARHFPALEPKFKDKQFVFQEWDV